MRDCHGDQATVKSGVSRDKTKFIRRTKGGGEEEGKGTRMRETRERRILVLNKIARELSDGVSIEYASESSRAATANLHECTGTSAHRLSNGPPRIFT